MVAPTASEDKWGKSSGRETGPVRGKGANNTVPVECPVVAIEGPIGCKSLLGREGRREGGGTQIFQRLFL